MDTFLYCLFAVLVRCCQALPMTWVARIGRTGGQVVYALDARHRRVALKNLTHALGAERTPEELRAIAAENFRRIGENFCCAVRSAAMRPEELRRHLEFVGFEAIDRPDGGEGPGSVVFAIGHFGNYELYARVHQFLTGFRSATTYRGVKPPFFNRLLLGQRQRHGTLYFERRAGDAPLRDALARQNLLVGLLVDQHAGDRGLWLPFFGRECSTSPAPAVYALRYKLPLYTAVCFRAAPGRWRVELGAAIATTEDGRPRDAGAIMLDVNRAFERAVRRDPANWFWLHNRWKPRRRHAAHPAPRGPVHPAPSRRAPADADPV